MVLASAPKSVSSFGLIRECLSPELNHVKTLGTF